MEDKDVVSSVSGAEAPKKNSIKQMIIIGACLLGLAIVLAIVNN